jgi:hypothetical protein
MSSNSGLKSMSSKKPTDESGKLSHEANKKPAEACEKLAYTYCHQSLTQLARHNRVQLIWVPGHEDIVGNETAEQLARTGSEHPFAGPEPACGISVGVSKKAVRDWMNRNHKKILGIHNWTQTGTRTYIRALCQKNEGSLEIKQRPTKMGGRTTYRTLSPQRAPFQIGID